jgi:CubicO group peptidase (beta-lactamase class C family)
MWNNIDRKSLAIILVVSIILIGVYLRINAQSVEINTPLEPTIMPDYWPTEGWEYATPAQRGMDSHSLEAMVQDIKASSYQVDSALVIKNGYIVLDEYFGSFRKGNLHNIFSCTKSFVSTLFGIAQEKGDIPDLDTRLLDLYPKIIPENQGNWKESITLRHLLMMSAGFDARDSWLYEWEGLYGLHSSEDAVKYMLDLPMDFEPGSRFEYTNGVSHLLSCIITEKTGVSAAEYAETHLFSPLGITRYTWEADNQGRNWGYNKIHLTPHDMAKIGYLFLKNGEWDGVQIVSEEWVKAATAHRIDANIVDGYGYHWWVGEEYYLALGYQGQFIFIYPEHDLVIVFTGGSQETFNYTIELPERYIIPALG